MSRNAAAVMKWDKSLSPAVLKRNQHHLRPRIHVYLYHTYIFMYINNHLGFIFLGDMGGTWG